MSPFNLAMSFSNDVTSSRWHFLSLSWQNPRIRLIYSIVLVAPFIVLEDLVMKKNLFIVFVLLVFCPSVLAQEVSDDPYSKSGLGSRINGVFGVDIKSQYLFYGCVYEDQGVIAQPYLNLSLNVYKAENNFFLNKIDIGGGIWSSLHSNHTDEGLTKLSVESQFDCWYEFDFQFGGIITMFKGLEASCLYREMHSPNDGFISIKSLEIGLAYKAEIFKNFKLFSYIVSKNETHTAFKLIRLYTHMIDAEQIMSSLKKLFSWINYSPIQVFSRGES